VTFSIASFSKQEKTVSAIILVSFLLKLVIGLYFSETFFGRGNSFSAYNSIAFNLVGLGEFSITPGVPSLDYEPLYPMFLALAYGFFGKSWFGVTFLQAILHAATATLIYGIASKLFNRTAGAVAAVYFAFYPYLFFHSLSVVDTTLYVFFCIFFLWIVIYAESNGNMLLYSLAGLVLGAAMLTRASALAYLPIPGLALVYLAFKGGMKVGVQRMAVLLLAFSVVVGPWVFRNYSYSGSPVISTHGPFGFWQGNNERSLEYLKNDVSLDRIYHVDPPRIYQEFPTRPRPPKEAVQVAAKYQAEAVGFIKSNPGQFLKLAFVKFQKFWSLSITPRMESYKYSSHSWRQAVYFLSYAPLLLLMPFGLVILSGHNRAAAVMISGVLATYTLAHMIVMGFTRARLPIDPVLMILAGISIAWALEKAGYGLSRKRTGSPNNRFRND
jgi:4-amino-4-deoxy-L-arabinose transferase-like glycosyltransferase